MKRFFHDTITVEATGIETTAEGFLVVPARLTRSGIFKYPYGNVYRSDYEVTRWESVKSLKGKSVTDLHPEGDTFVEPENWKQYEVGTVIDPYGHDNTISSNLLIKEKKVIDRILEKKATGESIEISCGYYADLIEYKEDKVDPVTNEKYMFEQKDIIYNHVALVPKGRAGANIKLMLDSMDKQTPEVKMKLKINEKLAGGKKILDAMELVTDESNEKSIDNMEKALDSACGEIDGLTEKLNSEKKKVEDAENELAEIKKTHIDAKEIETLVNHKIGLIQLCDALNIEVKDKSATDLENEIIKVAMPKVDIKDKSDDYRKAILDSSLEIAKEMGSNNLKTRKGFEIKDAEKVEELGVFEKIEKGE